MSQQQGGRPKISIIMNCLNAAKWLPETLEYVRRQTFQDYEIIFWDNNSSDGSPDIAAQFGPRMRVWRNPETIPLGMARNRALAMAQGEYVAFLDCDDIWMPEKLEKQLALFEANPRLGLACTDTAIFYDGKVRNTMFAGNAPARGMVFEELMARQWIAMSSAMLRRTALESCKLPHNGVYFDERLNICEEADLFYRIAHDWEVDYVDEVLSGWRMHGANTTFRNFDRLAEETRIILERHRQIYPDYDKKWPRVVAMLENRANFQQALALWRSGNGRQARALIWKISPKTLKHRIFQLVSWLPGKSFDLFAKIYFILPARFRR